MPDSGDHLKKVWPGAPLRPSASAWNEFIAAAKKVNRLTVGGAASAGKATPLGSVVVVVKVTGNATGGGKYTGFIMNLGSGSTVPESGDLAESDIGTAGATTILILNPPELGQSTHDLTSGTPKSKYFPAIKSPRLSDAGKMVYVIAGFDWESC